MVHEILLYDLQHAPPCAKVRMCLQVKGISYRRVAPSAAEVLRGALLPRLAVDAGELSGADAIVRQIEAEWPSPALVPPEADARAYCLLLEGWADAALGAAVQRVLWGPEPARATQAHAVATEVSAAVLAPAVAAALSWQATHLACRDEDALRSLREHLDVLATMLGDRSFLLGRTLTRADVAAFAQLACLCRMRGDVSLDTWPGLAAWFARLEAMPALGSAFGA